jgi:hypothetical protein
MNRVTAPFAVPQKWSVCRGKAFESGVRALCGQQWTRLPFCSSREVLPQRGMAFALSVELGGDDDRPFRPPLASPSSDVRLCAIARLREVTISGPAVPNGRRSALPRGRQERAGAAAEPGRFPRPGLSPSPCRALTQSDVSCSKGAAQLVLARKRDLGMP